MLDNDKVLVQKLPEPMKLWDELLGLTEALESEDDYEYRVGTVKACESDLYGESDNKW